MCYGEMRRLAGPGRPVGRSGGPAPAAPLIALTVFVAFFVAPLLAAGPAVWPLLAVLIVAMSITRPRRRFPTHRFDHQRIETNDFAVAERRPAGLGGPGRPWGAPTAGTIAHRRSPSTDAVSFKPLPPARSPFDKPAFWDLPTTAVTQRPVGSTPGLDRTPPAWDPLGVAPFAWDLPEPPPLSGPRAGRLRVRVTRVGILGVLMAGALIAIGDVAGWWPLTGLTMVGTTVAALVIGTLIGSAHSRAVRRTR